MSSPNRGKSWAKALMGVAPVYGKAATGGTAPASEGRRAGPWWPRGLPERLGILLRRKLQRMINPDDI